MNECLGQKSLNVVSAQRRSLHIMVMAGHLEVLGCLRRSAHQVAFAEQASPKLQLLAVTVASLATCRTLLRRQTCAVPMCVCSVRSATTSVLAKHVRPRRCSAHHAATQYLGHICDILTTQHVLRVIRCRKGHGLSANVAESHSSGDTGPVCVQHRHIPH